MKSAARPSALIAGKSVVVASLDAFIQDEDTQAALNRALRTIAKLKVRSEALHEAVYQAAKDSISGLRLPATTKPLIDKRPRPETAVAVLSDWQLAKVTPDYNTAVCEKRMDEYAARLEKIVSVQRADHPVKELRVYLLGDLVEGELIFPGQAHLVDASLYRQVTVDGPRILGGFLRRMLGVFESVRVVGVIGNHGSLGGRARKDYHPESNADAMMYRVVKMLLENEKRLDFEEPSTRGERHWYAVDQIGEKRFFMFHGDQIKGGFAGFPWYAFERKLLRWRDMYHFDYSLSGHFHTPVRFRYGDRATHWGNGTTESTNTYAAEQLAAQGTPSQGLLFVHPTKGVTAEYKIALKS